MASVEAVRALRSILRTVQTSPHLREQRRTICAQCLARPNTRRQARVPRPQPTPLRGLLVEQHVGGARGLATVADARRDSYNRGPIAEYDARVRAGRLRDDDHQRSLIQSLQDLHDSLAQYRPPKVVYPTIESLQPKKTSFLGSIFGGGSAGGKLQMKPIAGLPKGIYMYGDVGSGKTMMMDLFFDTLPDNITHKTRIHFHNFMQDVHKEVHKMKMKHGNDTDVIPYVAASIAERSSVLCYDEFQCTDVADAMILRRLMESLMAHGTVLVTTSNRHPTELYKNGIQRESFVPSINLLVDQLRILNLDSTTDYRKIPRPPSGVYHHPLDASAQRHAEHWFKFLGDFDNDPPHPVVQHVWGREIQVPRASGKACWYTFDELIGRPTGAADYIELVRTYDAFIITEVPGMSLRTRDLARRFITFLDAVYEGRAKLVLTTAVPLTQLFMSQTEVDHVVDHTSKNVDGADAKFSAAQGADVNDAMRMMMDDLGMSMESLKSSSIFTGDEEAFAFARALSRLVEMGSQEWVERGLGMEHSGGKKDADDYMRVRGHWRLDSY